MATNKPKPALASHAENASKSIGVTVCETASSCKDQIDRAIKRDNIIPSRQRRAERRWVRWKASPAKPRANAEEKANCVGVIWGW